MPFFDGFPNFDNPTPTPEPVEPVGQAEPTPEPVEPVKPTPEPVEPVGQAEPAPEPKAKPRAKAKGRAKGRKREVGAKTIEQVLAARDRLDDDTRRVLSGLTGHDDDAALTGDVLALTGGNVDAKAIGQVLAARDRLDGNVRRTLSGLTGHDDDAALTADLIERRAAQPARLLLDALDADGDVARTILLMQRSEKDPSLTRAAGRLAQAVNPDLDGRFATTNQPALIGALASTVGLLDRAVLEALV